ncbi:MAG: SDR family NAD(P)-dependent oxidoreductase [Persicimonas sp.]
MNVAIVTGASSGLGREYARQLAPRPEVDQVWVLARREGRLEEVCDELVGADGRVFAVDLTDDEQTASLYEALANEAPTVSWLVNNAGFGKIGPFAEGDVDDYLTMIDLNVRALTEMTHRVLPYCERGSKIVQVASSAGFGPLGNLAVYAATKAFVVNLSNALSVELKERGITVTAACPGPVDTEFQSVAYNGRYPEPPAAAMADAADVVRKSIADARKGRLNSVYGAAMKTWSALSGLVPRRLSAWASARTYDQPLEQADSLEDQ